MELDRRFGDHVGDHVGDRFVDPLEELDHAVDAVAARDPFSYADKGSILKLVKIRSKIESILNVAEGSFDEGGEWASEGAKDAAAWLATRCHLPAHEARSGLRRGHALATLPLCAEAFAQGSIGAAQVDALARAANVVEPGVLAHDESLLVEAAQEMKFGAFNAALTYWTQYANPLGAEAAEAARQARRSALITQDAEGMMHLRADLPAIAGSIVANELRRLSDQLFDADWAQAKAELGRDPKVAELERTPAQRGADALVEMATGSRTAPADGRRPEPLFSVVVDYRTLGGRICQLEGGGVLAPGSLLAWMDCAWFERIVFGPKGRAEVSVKARFFTGATRRAIEVRDLQCTHEFCELPAERCQIDHIALSSKGGETNQDNGRLLCGFHNRLRNGGPKGPQPSDQDEPDEIDDPDEYDESDEYDEPEDGREPPDERGKAEPDPSKPDESESDESESDESESGDHGPEPGG